MSVAVHAEGEGRHLLGQDHRLRAPPKKDTSARGRSKRRAAPDRTPARSAAPAAEDGLLSQTRSPPTRTRIGEIGGPDDRLRTWISAAATSLGAFEGNGPRRSRRWSGSSPIYPEQSRRSEASRAGSSIAVHDHRDGRRPGSTKDVIVTRAYPSGDLQLGRALKAVRKFKYKPKVVDGTSRWNGPDHADPSRPSNLDK